MQNREQSNGRNHCSCAIEAVSLGSGASGAGYPSVVGSGPNATILHYAASRRRMEDGDLLLGGFFSVKRYDIGHLR